VISLETGSKKLQLVRCQPAEFGLLGHHTAAGPPGPGLLVVKTKRDSCNGNYSAVSPDERAFALPQH
jgi:hypothetical protein